MFSLSDESRGMIPAFSGSGDRNDLPDQDR